MKKLDPNKANLGLDTFIANVVKKGVSRANRFNVSVTPPKTMIGVKSLISPVNFTLQCEAVSIPGMNLITNDVGFYGEARQMPSQRLFSEVHLSFIADIDLNIKRFFDSWLESIINPITRHCSYYQDYVSTMEIVVNDVEDNIRYKINLFECYPKSVSDIALDYSALGIMKVTVSMMYKYYTIDTDVKDQDKAKNLVSLSANVVPAAIPVTTASTWVSRFIGVNNVE